MVYFSFDMELYLSEYLYALWGRDEPMRHVRFPEGEYLYHTVFSLMTRRPPGVSPIDRGNITIALPAPRRKPIPGTSDGKSGKPLYYPGKDPRYNNYIGKVGQQFIERKVKGMFYAHCNQFVDEQVNTYGQSISEALYIFMCRFHITGVDHETLRKRYYRWRYALREQIRKRKYAKT